MKLLFIKYSPASRCSLLCGIGACLLIRPLTAKADAPAPDSATTVQQTTPTPDDRLLLRFKPQAGQTYAIKMTMDQKISQTLPTRRMDINQSLSFGYDYKIQSVDDAGNITMDVTFRTVRQSMQVPTGPGNKTMTQTYDSTRPTQSNAATSPFIKTMGAIWNAILDSSFTVQLSPAGKLLKISGIDALWDRMSKALIKDSAAPKAELEVTMRQIKKQFSDQMLGSMNQMWAFYPTNPIGINETWKNSAELNAAGLAKPISINTSYTLLSRANGLATIGLKSQFQYKQTITPAPGSGTKITVSVTGNQNGSIKAEESTGWTSSAVIDQRMTMQTQMTRNSRVNGKNVQESQTIPGYIKGHITLESHLKPTE